MTDQDTEGGLEVGNPEHSAVADLLHDEHWLEDQGRLIEPMYVPVGGSNYVVVRLERSA